MVVVDGTEWWDTAEVAAYLGVEPVTVSAYRSREQMPAPTYFGRSPMWRRVDIERWRPGVSPPPST